MANTRLTVVESALSPARETLHKVNREIAELKAIVSAAQIPLNRLLATNARLAAAEQKLATARAADDQVLADWLSSGGEGALPQPSHEMLR